MDTPALASSSLWPIAALLQRHTLVDLTHGFRPGIPHFPDDPDEQRTQLCAAPFEVTWFGHVGQWGTHVDAPSHCPGASLTLDEIPCGQMVLPLVVIDISGPAGENPDRVLTGDDLLQWEHAHGPIPGGSLVALRTDWSLRWPNQIAMENCDHQGISHTPGWSVEALELLSRGRGVSAIGHETLNTDPGYLTSRNQFPAQTFWLQENRWQVEPLSRLCDLPPAGAVSIVSWPKAIGANGFPARALAWVPTP